VAKRGFTASAARGTTAPSTLMTVSGRSASTSAKTGLVASITHWVRPK
jgi:hypothetical protein